MELINLPIDDFNALSRAKKELEAAGYSSSGGKTEGPLHGTMFRRRLPYDVPQLEPGRYFVIHEMLDMGVLSMMRGFLHRDLIAFERLPDDRTTFEEFGGTSPM